LRLIGTLGFVTSSPAPDPRLKVALACPTFKRPDCLEALLPRLVAQATGLPHDTRVVIVDNDEAESARALVTTWADRGVDYVAEHRPGIAAARNRALDEAADADLLVFLDDDEEPGDGWLATLVSAWLQWRCAAVSGPVISRFDGPVDAWVAACATFKRRRLETGSQLDGAATNNMLLDLRQLSAIGLRFDDRFGLTGGSDSMFTRTLAKRGGVIRWCDEAVMFETVPQQRATRDWALKRKRRSGNVWSRVRLELADSGPERAKIRASLALRAALRIVRGLSWVLAGAATGNLERRVDGELDIATGRGVMRGAFGHVIAEYERTPD